MRLKELNGFQEIIIQCHNNPDADAISSGFGVYTYFKEKGKSVRFVYSGRNRIQKANLRLMVNELNIPIEYVEELNRPELLVTVDCQYGEGNVELFEAENVAVIDHHQIEVDMPGFHEVRSNLGSCATIVWDMLKNEGININDNKRLSTALYYGLMTDTNNFTEMSHPLDRDMRDDLDFDRSLIVRFINTNLSLREVEIAGKALMQFDYNETYRYAIAEVEPCDPNILGMISDIMLEVDVVDTCLVYNIIPGGIKLSVRSCVKEVKACELVKFVTDGIGSGGGHLVKAGGFIQEGLIKCKADKIGEFFKSKMDEYFSNVKIIYAKDYIIDITDMDVYRKLPVSIGYVKAADLCPAGSEVNIRTLEGDLDIKIDDDIYIMIGMEGEVYPIKKEKFRRSYKCTDEPYVFRQEYEPTVKEISGGKSISIVPYANSCIATGEAVVYAKKLKTRAKVFSLWDEEKYMQGKPGDYLAVRKDDLHDIYIIEESIFKRTYEAI